MKRRIRIIRINGKRYNIELIFIVHVDELGLIGRQNAKFPTIRMIL